MEFHIQRRTPYEDFTNGEVWLRAFSKFPFMERDLETQPSKESEKFPGLLSLCVRRGNYPTSRRLEARRRRGSSANVKQ